MYESAKLIMSSRPQGMGSRLCYLAHVVPISCPFKIWLCLCCVRFYSAISPWVSWPCAECGVGLGAFRTSPVASLHVDVGELPLELRRQQLCLQYISCLQFISILQSNQCNPAFSNVFGTGFWRSLFDARTNTIPTFGIRINQNILDCEVHLNSIAINSTPYIRQWVLEAPGFQFSLPHFATSRRFLLLFSNQKSTNFCLNTMVMLAFSLWQGCDKNISTWLGKANVNF